ncbi:MAG: hypothetical protein V4617_07290 [Gemmatimonadota bacterium]
MSDDVIDELAQREARTLDAWLAAARLRLSTHTGPMPPRFIAENVKTMAAYMGMTPAAADALAPAMALSQMFLPSAYSSDPENFRDIRARLPHSSMIVRDGVASVAEHPQLVYAAFHMTGFPLVAAMLVPAVFDVHGSRGHVLVAQRNAAWLTSDAGRWVSEIADVIWTDSRGLRQLHAGLHDGTIRRLLILVDGPHRPGQGTHPLMRQAPTLGFKTGLLRRLIDMGIPVLPVTHRWADDRLDIEWHPLLPSSSDDAVATTAGLIESLLQRHPEQWNNWPAARAALTPRPA